MQKAWRSVVLGFLVWLFLVAGTASAQYVGGAPPDAGPVDRGEAVADEGAARVQEARGRGLAVTGGDVAALVVFASCCVAAGIVLLRRTSDVAAD